MLVRVRDENEGNISKYNFTIENIIYSILHAKYKRSSSIHVKKQTKKYMNGF